MAPVPVNESISNMKDLLRHTIGRNVSIETCLAGDPLHGICDPNQLENAILNLAINARDAMPDGGSLTIATSLAPLASDAELEPGEYVRLSITDTGQGMAPDVLARAMEPFFSTKPLGKGTGLGLAQVYGIARQSGGTVRIESEPGRGTTVHLLLRSVPPQADHASGPADKTAQLRDSKRASGRVLVIDDDQEVRAFLAEALTGLGYSVDQAEDGTLGLEQLERKPPDLLLLDYAMPGRNGAEIAAEARKRRPQLPIVFVTGYAESEQLEAVLGADVPVLRKPFTVAQLAAAVDAQIHVATADTCGS